MASPALQRGEKELHKLVTESRRDGARTLFMLGPIAPAGPFSPRTVPLSATCSVVPQMPHNQVGFSPSGMHLDQTQIPFPHPARAGSLFSLALNEIPLNDSFRIGDDTLTTCSRTLRSFIGTDLRDTQALFSEPSKPKPTFTQIVQGGGRAAWSLRPRLRSSVQPM